MQCEGGGEGKKELDFEFADSGEDGSDDESEQQQGTHGNATAQPPQKMAAEGSGGKEKAGAW